MIWPPKKILITGSEGFIGRHFERRLIEMGHHLTCVDIANGQDARTFFQACDTEYDLVLHCAAHVGGRTDIDGRPAYLQAYNIQLDGGLYEWALRTRPGHVVYFSSSAAYPAYLQSGDTDLWQLHESHIDLREPEAPESSYGWTKLAGEVLADYAREEGIRTTVFRPFSGYGTDQALTYPFPAFIDRAQRRADPFDIWGDGTQVRDWIHVDDIVNAVLIAVENDIPGPINLCSGEGVTMTDLADRICKADGYDPVLRFDPDAPRGVTYRVGDPTKLNRFYTPRVSLDEGIKRALVGAS